MIIVTNAPQGTPEWHKVRLANFTASEASAMMGKGKYQSRNDLLKLKKTGIAPDVSPAQQALFDKGHAAEAAIRPVVEDLIGEDLFPVVGILEGSKIMASFDGLTMMQNIVFENKLWNEQLAERVRQINNGEPAELDEHYSIQLDQQLLVSGAEKAIFVVSDGTPEKMVYCWYTTNKEKLQALIDGWTQFAKDLEAFEVQPEPELIEVKKVPSLPALRISVTGMVNSSNLDAYRDAAFAVIESVNTKLVTDQDFADAEEAVKFFSKSEKELADGKKAILGQTASIDDVFRMIDEVSEAMRQKRLFLDKLVKQQKETIKLGIISSAREALAVFWNAETKGYQHAGLCPIKADFAGAIKGLRTISSIENAADSALAAAKIEAGKLISRLKINTAVFEKEASQHKFLFSDLAQLIYKEDGDFRSVVLLRIADHEAREQARLEAERERIAQQERAKAQAELEQAKAEAERQQARAEDSKKIDAFLEEAKQAGTFKKSESLPVQQRLPRNFELEIEAWANEARVSKKKLQELKEILISYLYQKAA